MILVFPNLLFPVWQHCKLKWHMLFRFLGFFGNVLSSYILSGKSMRNTFNLLLIALAVIDNTYLFGAILNSFMKRFNLKTQIQIIMFPYFLYPLHMMAMTGSILMTVAIALDRYTAVQWPISYSQVSLDYFLCYFIHF